MPSFKKIIPAALLLAAAALNAPVSAQVNATDLRIVVNSVGFLPDYPKKASVRNIPGAPGSDAAGPAVSPPDFSVKRASDNETVFQGVFGPVIKNTDTPDSVRIADFSDFKEPGKYYIEYNGQKSPEFEIGPDVLHDPYKVMMQGFYLWRCGHPGGVSATYKGRTYSHGQCHTGDSLILLTVTRNQGMYGTTITAGQTAKGGDGRGGWHDAGDFNKYVTNSGLAVGVMLKAWEHHGKVLDTVGLINVQKSGSIPAYLTEVKWNLDWMSNMQHTDGSGKVHHKLSAIDWAGNVLPTAETAQRYFISWSTGATGSFAGSLALASRIYRPYDSQLADKWLEQAKLSYQTLKSNPSYVKHDSTLTVTGMYEENETLPSHVDNDLDGNKRLWAAAELWETTGEPEYLADFEARASAANMHNYVVWQDLRSMALSTYLMSDRPGKSASLVASLETELVKAADKYVENVNTHGYARAFGADSKTYHWGNNGSLAAITYILNTAYQFTGDRKYREAGHDIIGHLLGRNYFGRSFVTGIGYNPPANTHCRRSIYDKAQWPGYLVGGPNAEAYQPYTAMGGGTIPQGATCDVSGTRMPGVCYFDYNGDYARNEIAINWNASMVYALSGFLAEVEPPEEPPVGVISRNTAVKPAGKGVKITRMISVKNGRMSAAIPPGARVYSLDGRLVARRKAGDAKAPVIRRNGVFIMKVDGR